MKQLVLMRHAKSDRSDPGAIDHERPLNARGRNAAPVMAEWLLGRGVAPDVALVSSSVRTMETFDRLRRVMTEVPRPTVLRSLYLADATSMLDEIRRQPESAASVLLIGHEPGLGDLVRLLAAPTMPDHCRAALERFPTAAVAVFEVPGSWAALGPGGARMMDHAVPRDLTATLG